MNGKRYMIRNREGLYSRGGYTPVEFVERAKGKIWNGIGPLKNHLNHIMMQEQGIPEDWVVIEVQLIESDYVEAKEMYEKQYKTRRALEAMDDKRRRKEYLESKMAEIQSELQTL